MKTAIHYFSGTGNTARAVAQLAARLAATGQEVSRQVIRPPVPPPTDIPDLTVVAFPILSWAAPHFVLDYARRLPRAQGARAAVLAASGGFGAQAVGEMERVLRRRGYRVVASGEAVYPDNWTLAQSPPTGPELEAALARGDAAVALFADRVAAGIPARFRCAFVHQLWSWPIARLFRACGRRFMGKFFIADDRCTACGRCAADCPVRAIRMAGEPARPRWSADCAACYRCINLCPAQAIQVSGPLLAIHLLVDLAATVGWVIAIGWIFRRLAGLPGIAQVGATTLFAGATMAIATVLQLTLGAAALQWLANRPRCGHFFQRSHTRDFGRYRAPGFQPGKPGN